MYAVLSWLVPALDIAGICTNIPYNHHWYYNINRVKHQRERGKGGSSPWLKPGVPAAQILMDMANCYEVIGTVFDEEGR